MGNKNLRITLRNSSFKVKEWLNLILVLIFTPQGPAISGGIRV